MDTTWLLVLIPLLEISTAIPYIIDIARGKTHPEIATWISWFFVALLASVVSWSNHIYPSAVFSTALAIECGLILLLAENKNTYSHTRYDVMCLIGVVLGTVAWVFTDNPLFAMSAVIIADFIAAIPTYLHSWKSPEEETVLTFAITILVNILMIIAITEHNFLTLAQPLYLFCANIGIVFVIMYRKRIVHTEKKLVNVVEKDIDRVL